MDFSDSGMHAAPQTPCICVPARNEAERLPRLLQALAEQDWPFRIPVLIAVNNSSDATLALSEDAQTRHADRLSIAIENTVFPPDRAHAGSARRHAMDAGLRLLPDLGSGILVSTDADARPPQHWLSSIMRAIDRGSDLVGGRIVIDEEESLPVPVARLQAAWDAYWEMVRTIEDEMDPVPWDPAPRHGDHTGASLAITGVHYLAAGGIPIMPSGEDRALVTAAVANGAKLTHPHDVWVRVSPRRDGRAQAGMAEAMSALFAAAQSGDTPMVPGYDQWRARARWRRDLRQAPDGFREIARCEAALPPMRNDTPLSVAEQ